MERMLSALMAQTRKLDALFILIHPRETETADLLKNILGSAIPYTLIYKDQSGPIAAMLKTLHLMSCDVVAFTHDDAAPRPDWLARIERAGSKTNCNTCGRRKPEVINGKQVSAVEHG
jgi:hypothetical protein